MTELKPIAINLGEATTNTYRNLKVEIPNSEGAKSVHIISSLGEFADYPDPAAGAVGQGIVHMGVGDQSARTTQPNISDDGIFDAFRETVQMDTAGDIMSQEGNVPKMKTGMIIPVPKDSNGKYYITAHIQGTGNVSVLNFKGKLFAAVSK